MKSAKPVRLVIQPEKTGFPIPGDFLGLSYESAQLAQPEFFSASNAGLAGFLHTLGPNGILRIGGNTSEYAFWTPQASWSSGRSSAAKTPQVAAAVGPDKGYKPAPPTETTPQAIRNLREFLDTVNWRCIYGFNLGKGTPERAADEAKYVADTLGDRLVCLQIGNEADLFNHNGLRAASYGYPEFAKDWERFHRAVHARVPNADFAGPDTAGTATWIEEFAQQFGEQVTLLTTHYYAEGPPTDPSMTIERLLQPSPNWEAAVAKIRRAMAESHLPYRLSETNSCYSGGKEGVSNTFASSLWALDLMFQLVGFGASGVNFHGGGYGWYAPIVGTIPNGFVARPEYYALLLFSQLVGGRMVSSHVEPGSPGLVCHALRNRAGKLAMVVVNKNPHSSFDLDIEMNAPCERVSVRLLLAPSLDDEADTTFAGAPVGAAGLWRAERVEHIFANNGAVQCAIPAASAALLSCD